MRTHVVIRHWLRYEAGNTGVQALQFVNRLWAAVQELAEACLDLFGLLTRVIVLICTPAIGPIRTERMHRQHVRDSDRLRELADTHPDLIRGPARAWRRAYPNHWLYAELEGRLRDRG